MLQDVDLNRFFTLSPEMQCIADPQGHSLWLNETWEHYLGYSIQAMLSQNLDDFSHPDEHATTLVTDIMTQSDGSAISFTRRFRHHNGSYRWLRWNALFDAREQRIYASARDITEEVEHRADENHQRDIQRATASMAHIGGWQLNLETMITLWSEEVYRIHEIEPGTPVELDKAINFYAPEARPLIESAVSEAIKNGTPWDLEVPFITARGNRLWVRAIGQAEWSIEGASSLWGTLLVVGFSLPWWWKPSQEKRLQPSTSNEDQCTGCGQCTIDCPYEAISMVPRAAGDTRLPHSRVTPELCVSCGICSASCDQLAIGPPHNIASEQQLTLRQFSTDQLQQTNVADVVVVVCQHNPGAQGHLEKYAAGNERLHVYPMGCIGTMHTDIIEELLEQCGGIFVWGCPSRNCLTREGVELLNLRSFHKRPPSVSRRIDKRRLTLEPHSSAERLEVFAKLKAFQQQLEDPDLPAEEAYRAPAKVVRYLKSTLATAILLIALGTLSRIPMGQEPDGGVLRLGAHITGLVIEECRTLSAAELAQRPLHMRQPQECEKIAPTYVLTVDVDGRQAVQRTIEHAGIRADQPLFLDEDIAVKPGAHAVVIDLRPQDETLQKAPQLQLATSIKVERSQVYLVGYNSERKALELRR